MKFNGFLGSRIQPAIIPRSLIRYQGYLEITENYPIIVSRRPISVEWTSENN